MDRDRLNTWLLATAIALFCACALLIAAALVVVLGKAIVLALALLLLVGVVIRSVTGETSGKAPDGTKYGGHGG